MAPDGPLPISHEWEDSEEYVSALLHFVTSSRLLRLLCGGVHILDFFVSSPDLYASVLSQDWREWLLFHSTEDLLEFLFREDLEGVQRSYPNGSWHGQRLPPKSFLDYVSAVRKLQLRQDHVAPAQDGQKMPPRVAVGMNNKKVLEVERFASYIDRLAETIAGSDGRNAITQIVDFGAGQGYLGRALASQPYHRQVIAVEGRSHNVKGARAMDTSAKIAPKTGIIRNKKVWRAEQAALKTAKGRQDANEELKDICSCFSTAVIGMNSRQQTDGTVDNMLSAQTPAELDVSKTNPKQGSDAMMAQLIEGKGSVKHVAHHLADGNLSGIMKEISPEPPLPPLRNTSEPPPSIHNTSPHRQNPNPRLLITSLHSCGNLSHHALRSLALNPSVAAIAVVGCCYNLLTERLTPPSYKLPGLRPSKDAAARTAAGDPHGFPMSARLVEYPLPPEDAPSHPGAQAGMSERVRGGKGVHFNITARMMAVQAPANWGKEDSSSFFTRHFFRALLQRVFVDRGVADVQTPPTASDSTTQRGGSSAAGTGAASQPIVIGSLNRKAYTSFTSYPRAAVERIKSFSDKPPDFEVKMQDLTDEELEGYAERYGPRKKELSILWTLMAFSATLVEATVLVDRWVWLREQTDVVGECWVEAVWNYGVSPRNLAVVGLRK